MRRTRHVIAVVVVATALCADRAVAAAPRRGRDRRRDLRGRSRSKLTTSLRQTVAPVSGAYRRGPSKPFELPRLPIREAASGVRAAVDPRSSSVSLLPTL